MFDSYNYVGKCTKVIDGDTIEAVIDLGFQIRHTVRVRIMNVDTPELFSPKSAEEKEVAIIMKLFLESLVLDKAICLTTKKDSTSFNRYLAHVYLPQAVLNEGMHYVDITPLIVTELAKYTW